MTTDIKVIAPQGILDGTQAKEFRIEVDESLKEGTKIILVDFSHVTFMDSSGLGALVLALKSIRSKGSKIILCSINEQVKMLFELTSMDKVFEIFTDEKSFRNSLCNLTE